MRIEALEIDRVVETVRAGAQRGLFQQATAALRNSRSYLVCADPRTPGKMSKAPSSMTLLNSSSLKDLLTGGGNEPRKVSCLDRCITVYSVGELIRNNSLHSLPPVPPCREKRTWPERMIWWIRS
jgi:hypothetical protein